MKNVENHPSARRNPKLVLLSLLARADELEALSVQYKVEGHMYNECCDYLTAEDLAFIIALLNNHMLHLLNDTDDDE